MGKCIVELWQVLWMRMRKLMEQRPVLTSMLPVSRTKTGISDLLAGSTAAGRASVTWWRRLKRQWQGERSRMLGDGSETTHLRNSMFGTDAALVFGHRSGRSRVLSSILLTGSRRKSLTVCKTGEKKRRFMRFFDDFPVAVADLSIYKYNLHSDWPDNSSLDTRR